MSFRNILASTLSFMRPSSTPSMIFLSTHTQIVAQSGELLKELVGETDRTRKNQIHEKIVEMEKIADGLEKQGIDAIHKSIILPFDRSLLLRALELSDDVIDGIRKTSFEITRSGIDMTDEMRKAAEAIRLETQEMQTLPDLLKLPERNSQKIWGAINRIHEHEKTADHAHRSLIENIEKLSDKPAIEIIMTLRISDRLEAIADTCEDFAQECGRILSDNS